MLDFKQYSIKECIEQACFGKWHSPLIIGTTENKFDSYIGQTSFTQYYTYNDEKFMAWSTWYDGREYEPNKEFEFTVKTQEPDFRDRSYHLHYILRRFDEILELKNIGFAYKIKKDGSKYLSKKRYEFKNKTLRMDVLRNEYTWYYESHQYMKKINKNKTSEHYVRFKGTELEIRENYNSKGVCTRSLLHIGDGRSIQIHLKKGVVSAYCQCEFGTLKNCTINLPYLNDASVLNLYDTTNCFNLDLMIPHNELFEAYTSSLKLLKHNITRCVYNDEHVNPVLRTMMEHIQEYEKKN
ncbi:hypothetical protein GAP32_060 [Cronobacter phage vB_CsaM_GAP32]|uniref:Uncharacterized protein n=1 Tax=Cronobacter phage vB_CsaM_GAP32 TaxID=1141136 RepID=K4F6F7_9CAUD|nr:hypothetical protein GAP32_060 [Cronobacter phage vB_CsaM_GAP32]AFC21508.1 hypothetical protein GAP32_060 [Cronobacter phage vB_CsaM_GAP32]